MATAQSLLERISARSVPPADRSTIAAARETLEAYGAAIALAGASAREATATDVTMAADGMRAQEQLETLLEAVVERKEALAEGAAATRQAVLMAVALLAAVATLGGALFARRSIRQKTAAGDKTGSRDWRAPRKGKTSTSNIVQPRRNNETELGRVAPRPQRCSANNRTSRGAATREQAARRKLTDRTGGPAEAQGRSEPRAAQPLAEARPPTPRASMGAVVDASAAAVDSQIRQRTTRAYDKSHSPGWPMGINRSCHNVEAGMPQTARSLRAWPKAIWRHAYAGTTRARSLELQRGRQKDDRDPSS